MTGDYTFVTPERQNELTRRIQTKLAAAGKGVIDETKGAAVHTTAATQELPQLASKLIQ
jgi:hypothetical protein